jgi:hypothetical protein
VAKAAYKGQGKAEPSIVFYVPTEEQYREKDPEKLGEPPKYTNRIVSQMKIEIHSIDVQVDGVIMPFRET